MIANSTGGITAPNSVAVDGAGTLYIPNSSTAVFIIPAGSTCGTTGGCAQFNGFTGTAGVATDGAGNLYIADGTSISRSSTLRPASGRRSPALPLQSNVLDVTVDTAGNVYTVDNSGSTVGKFTGGTGTIASVSSGFTHPFGIRADPAGNLYVVDAGAAGPAGRLFFLAAGSSTPQQIAVTGTLHPDGIAINAAGTLYVPLTEGSASGSVNDAIIALSRTGATFTVATDTAVGAKVRRADRCAHQHRYRAARHRLRYAELRLRR